MSRVNHADTLVTELRELQRRLRLLEAVRVAPAAATPAPATPAAVPGVPVTEGSAGHLISLAPSRPVDWPACTAAQWEELFDAALPAGARVSLRTIADSGTTGAVRIMLDGDQISAEFTVTEFTVTHTGQVPAGQVAVQGRRLTGAGAIRVWAFLLP